MSAAFTVGVLVVLLSPRGLGGAELQKDQRVDSLVTWKRQGNDGSTTWAIAFLSAGQRQGGGTIFLLYRSGPDPALLLGTSEIRPGEAVLSASEAALAVRDARTVDLLTGEERTCLHTFNVRQRRDASVAAFASVCGIPLEPADATLTGLTARTHVKLNDRLMSLR